MAKVDILAAWTTCKTLIQQAKEYANKGYSRIKDQSGKSKLSRFLNQQEVQEEKDVQLTTNNVPKEILDAISCEFHKVMEFIQSYLLLDDGAAFYGLILTELDVGLDYSQQGLIDLKVNQKPAKLTYNPFYGSDKSLNELLGDTLNEMVKIIYMHPVSYATLNREKDQKKHEDLEIASSVSSTDLVSRDIKYAESSNRVRMSSDLFTRSDFEAELETDKSVSSCQSLEYNFKIAQAFRKQKPQQPGQGSGQGQGQGNSNTISTPENGQGNPTHDWEGMTNPNDMKDDLKDMIKSAYDNLSDKQRGLIPNSMVSHIEMLFKKPELTWKQILRRFIGIIPSNHRPSRLRLNRRQPDRFDLSGQLSNKKVRLVIAIDTSGSMGDKEISYCMNEIYNIVKDYPTEITVIECDAEIGRVYNVRSPKDIKPEVTGRGGTSYVPVIDYINSHKFKDAVMIYFTDGYGDYEIERPHTYRNLWVVTGNRDNLSLKEPYGEVKTLKMDQDYQSRFA